MSAIPQTAEVEAKPEAEETDEDILKEARDRYRLAKDGEGSNYTDAAADLLFLTGGVNQWDSVAAQIRTAEKRPMITVNNLPTFLHQITNEQRQNKLGGAVSPVDGGADIITAEVIQGLIRHIEYDSNASVAANTAVNSAAAGGFGWFGLVTDFESEMSFDQKIMFRRIRNALSVHIDPLSQELDGSDMGYCFIDSLEPRKEFEREHPKANASNTSLIGQTQYQGWLLADTVLVCEYYRIKLTPDTLCKYMDGTTGWKSEQKVGAVVQVGLNGEPMERESARRVVEWFKITGADVLERTVIKCKWIPVFPVYGDEVDINGKVIRSGSIRHSKDSFSMYNYWITTATEEVALRPKTPFIGAVGQFQTSKNQWATANTRSYAYIEYDPVTADDKLAPPPARQPMADMPAGVLAMAMHAADNKKATMGLFDASLGAKGTATSGIQEREQQHQGDVANYHYTDNLKITYKHALRCVVDMLPGYYDGARAIRILGEDEKSKVVKINQPIEQKNPKTGAIERVMHDLTVGSYDITLQAGPSYATQRQEAAEFMTDAMQAAKDPAAASVLTYLAIKNRDVPGAQEATKMLKKLLPPNVSEPEDGEEPTVMTPKGPVPVSQVGQVIEEMGQALQNADRAMDEADALKEQNRQKELQIQKQDSDTKKYEAETARMVADAKLLEATNESKAADATLQDVATSAAREAVSLVGQMASAEALPAAPVDPLADGGGMGLPPESPPPVAAAEPPQVPM